MPYHALKKILFDTQAGRYDVHVVRALLTTVSLFPIGSHVTLSDGREGRVIRATGDPYDRPIVEAWSSEDAASGRSLIDLSKQQDLKIMDTLAEPT